MDHVITGVEDLRRVLSGIHDERTQRAARVAGWTWPEYAFRHLVIWDYLLQKTTPELRAEKTVFRRLLPKLAPSEHHCELAVALNLPNPPESALSKVAEKAETHNMKTLSAFCLRQLLVSHPKSENARKNVLNLYPEIQHNLL
jgi:hypothetical protein